MDRRSFLYGSVFGLSATALTACATDGSDLQTNPFTLGIASGDIDHASAVLWTRLAPDPDRADGGMTTSPVEVQWTLAATADLSQVIATGKAVARAELAHSVHVDIDGLAPGKEYWYQFSVGNFRSAIGRTKTLPDAENIPASLRFITTSCQNYSHGYFSAYQHMVDDKPDFLIHLGDYIYDTSFGETFRQHETESMPVSLNDFRRRHALYKTDPDLQQAHAQIPFFVTIDNHDALEDNDAGASARRRAAYQAWYEHMPVRGYDSIGDNTFDMHRQINVGDLLQISLLDSRQFRDQRAPCNGEYDRSYGFGNYRERCDAVFDDDRSMLGASQEAWLYKRLENNEAAWNIIASPGPFLPFQYKPDDKDLRYIGAWDAYPANRARLVNALDAAKTGHPLVLSGDVHTFWAIDGNLVPNVDERIPVTEFITSSVSANWPEPLQKTVMENLEINPQVRFHDPHHRGYFLHDVSSEHWLATARGVADAKVKPSVIVSLAQFEVTHGVQGFRMATKNAS